ncbi:hypothetical protein V6N12_043032 [Hibiscus sabdariffa]|uniref:Reverse transcriptase Ty1/copia-type domain-containing protein n=1 Tax=Hibiscus sabdariffa TaxID=183260 RepID=A0ABR2DI15_9ROSI
MEKGGSKSILMVSETRGRERKWQNQRTRHWKRNCHVYLEKVKKAKAVGAWVSETQPLQRSTREHYEHEIYVFLVTTHGDVILVDQDEPKTYQEAVTSPGSEKWLKAMRSEMDSMSENQVWTLVEQPEGVKPIGCKWVFKKKTNMDGKVQTYKGRLVAKASATTKEIVWIKGFKSELRVISNISDVVELRFDNNGDIVQAKEPRSHHGSKHTFKIFHHLMRRGNLKSTHG